MKKPSLVKDYLARYGAETRWKLEARRLDHIEQIVVIPALAEKDLLFATLESLAANSDAFLAKSLILCVINNKESARLVDRENNAQTLAILRGLIGISTGKVEVDDERLTALLQRIQERPVRLACIDASSPALEIPADVGGVGMARKIGMDMALRILSESGDGPRLILSLDADTLVEPNYLEAVAGIYTSKKMRTGIIAYRHQLPADEIERSAICRYEIFLRYWVLGLRYARSPYAFHSIGSTIVTTADSYLMVRGMNRREAGEDFYFLNKLAKNGGIRQITETIVYPSARISRRVPFGTGAAVEKIALKTDSEYRLYNPKVFVVLKEWIALMEESYGLSENQILDRARGIDPGLAFFLTGRGFLSVWPKIRRNAKAEKTYERQIHGWFDGFETLKLINFLSKEFYPRIALSRAVRDILEMHHAEGNAGSSGRNIDKTEDPEAMLDGLRIRAEC